MAINNSRTANPSGPPSTITISTIISLNTGDSRRFCLRDDYRSTTCLMLPADVRTELVDERLQSTKKMLLRRLLFRSRHCGPRALSYQPSKPHTQSSHSELVNQPLQRKTSSRGLTVELLRIRNLSPGRKGIVSTHLTRPRSDSQEKREPNRRTYFRAPASKHRLLKLRSWYEVLPTVNV